MLGLREINKRTPKAYFFHGQLQHLLLLVVLIPGALYLTAPFSDEYGFLGFDDMQWVWALIILVVVQQVLGWLVFRLQICYNWLSKTFGKADMLVWGILFFPLLIGRVFLHLAIAMSDRGSLGFARPLEIIIGLLLLIPFIYTLYSIKKYFGVKRALGADHFRTAYLEMPLVKEGVFKHIDDAMYVFIFLIFWSIGFLFGSRLALGLALFQHAYIWVHMYCTENPDMEILYDKQHEEHS